MGVGQHGLHTPSSVSGHKGLCIPGSGSCTRVTHAPDGQERWPHASQLATQAAGGSARYGCGSHSAGLTFRDLDNCSYVQYNHMHIAGDITARKGQGTAPLHGGQGHNGGEVRHEARRFDGRRVAMGLRSFPRDTTAGTRHVPHDQHDGAEAVGGVEGRCTRVGARKGENG